MDKRTKISKGYGFVTFKTAHSTQLALAPRETPFMIDGRLCSYKLAALKNENSPGDHSQIADRKLFIRGLHPNTDEQKLRSVFEAYGDIEECNILGNKSLNLC